LRVAQLVRLLVVEPTHQGSSPQLGAGACNFLNLSQDLTDAILSVCGDVLLIGACVLIGVSVYVCVWKHLRLYYVISKKEKVLC
jgi:hypothetical protein